MFAACGARNTHRSSVMFTFLVHISHRVGQNMSVYRNIHLNSVISDNRRRYCISVCTNGGPTHTFKIARCDIRLTNAIVFSRKREKNHAD